MVSAESDKVDFTCLRRLYQQSDPARAVLDHLASRERNWTSTTVDRIHMNVLGEGAEVSRADIVAVFKELDACGCGTFKSGRRGYPSRFEWSVQMVSVGQAASGETERVEEITDEDEGEDEGSSTLKHSFRLRPDHPISLELPTDLTAAEAKRLADFVLTLPFGE